MDKLPEPFGTCLTVNDIDGELKFYKNLYQHDEITEGVFAGIRYVSLMRDGEVAICLFQKGADNPLQDQFPVVKVDSVPSYIEKVKAAGGKTLIPTNACPCTGAPFSVQQDVAGNQFMIKQQRGTT